MPNKKLILGQITDLHARQAIHGSAAVIHRRSRDVLDLLPQAIDQLKAQGVNFLAVTGDLLDVPVFILHPNDYYTMPIEPWLPLIEADYRRVKAILDASGLPYMVLPGNHDYEPIMWQVFDRAANVVELAQGYRVVRFCDREWEMHVPHRYDRERKRWLQMLADTESPPQIHLQHYVITPQVESSYPHNYFEAEDLQAKNGASGRVWLALSGHYHRGSDLIKQGNCHFAVCPAFCEFPHPVCIYEVDVQQITMQTVELCDRPYRAGRPVVFLDRDGVINDIPSYSTGPEEMALIPGAAHAILQLKEAGFAVVVITNQSAVGAGHTSRRVVDMVNERMCQLLVEETHNPIAQPDAIFYSIGAGTKAVYEGWADQSVSKPSPLLLQRAEALLGLDGQNAWMVGDRISDLQAGAAYGATPILVRTGYGRQNEQTLTVELNSALICDDLAGAVHHILSSLGHSTYS